MLRPLFIHAQTTSLNTSNHAVSLKNYAAFSEYPIDRIGQLQNRPAEKIAKLDLFITINTGCNLQCLYCYEGEMTAQKHQVINPDTIQTSLDRILDAFNDSSGLQINASFLGGEPLFSWKVIETLVIHLVNRSCALGGSCHFFVYSNLTFLSKDILLFSRRYALMYFVNVEGPEDTHNRVRPHKLARLNAYRDTIRNIERLREYQITYQLGFTITSINIDRMLETHYLHQELGSLSTRLALLKPNEYNGKVLLSLLPAEEIFATRLLELIRDPLWLTHSTRQSYLRKLSEIREGKFDEDGAICSAANPQSIYIDQAGDLYNCLFLTGNKQYNLGPAAAPDRQRYQLVADGLARNQDPVCSQCAYLLVCGSACLLYKLHDNSEALRNRVRQLQCTQTQTIVNQLLVDLLDQSLVLSASSDEPTDTLGDITAEWRTWLFSNLRQGCPPAELVRAMLDSGYFYRQRAERVVAAAIETMRCYLPDEAPDFSAAQTDSVV